MRTLQVDNFSCIRSAILELDRLTVIIGPQASGKSVLGKLCYFAMDVGISHTTSVMRGDALEKFSQAVKSRFVEWFPMEAWGSKKFRIVFTAGDYSISLTRKSYKGKTSDDFRLRFSEQFERIYLDSLAQFEKFSSRDGHPELRDDVEQSWRIQEMSSGAYRKLLGKDVVQYQAFVPAGRSFFTSVGKAIAAFEQGRVLDPLILRFGRIYTAYRDRPPRFYNDRPSDKEVRKSIDSLMSALLGGRLQRDGDKEYVHAMDGRKIPLSALSSGQQELLPIVAFLPWFSRPRDGALCYIEEPEAHLFPSTQSSLVQALVMAAATASLVMTTHSPYVITKVNNLLKAGSLGRKQNDALRKELEALIPRRAWLSARSVRAYAIRDGELHSILGEDGLIDAEYLDEISSELNKEFSALLELEEKHV